MLFDIRGADFFRLQRANWGRVGDDLDPDVLFSGAYEDGQGIFLQASVDAPGTASGQNYTLGFGRTFARPPLVFGSLRLTQGLNHDGTQFFNAGECLAPCAFRRNRAGSAAVVNYQFNFTVTTTAVLASIFGFTGVVSFICLETGS